MILGEGVPRIHGFRTSQELKVVESIRWKSPEYLETDSLDMKMDVWSFGMTIYVRSFP